MRAIEIEVAQLRESDLYKLKTKAEEAEKEKRDLIVEMAKQLDKQIADARKRLAEVLKK
jgi:hypothetical protein